MTLLSTMLDRVDEQARAYLETQHESTLVVGLTVRGERSVRSFRSPGAVAAPLPTSDAIYEIGSISKLWTTTVLASLEQAGVLALDDALGEHLPELTLPPEVAALTLKQLATHSSGLPSVGRTHGGFIAEEARGTLPPYGAYTHYLRYRKEHLYRDLESMELVYPTGQGWLYSIIGMGTLGHVLERATGQPFEELLRTTLVEPLGLTGTGYALTPEQLARVVHGYDLEGQPLPNWYHDVLLPQGGIRSSMDDMLSFAEAHLQAGDGSSSLAAAMRRTREVHLVQPQGPHTPEVLSAPWTTEVRHGLAWRHITHPQGSASWHPGTTLFYHSALGVDVTAQVGCVLLTSNRHTLARMEQLNALFHGWFTEACTCSG